MGLPLNDTYCDIYIGRGAGKQLIDSIENAKKEIKIVSPYLSSYLVELLIKLHERNISIKLITTDDLGDVKDSKNSQKLIKQVRSIDEKALAKRENYQNIIKVLYYSIIGVSLLLFAWSFLINPIPDLFSLIMGKIIFCVVPTLTLVFIRKFYKNRANGIRIYTYSYEKLFPFKVYHSPHNTPDWCKDYFIHGKIYVIDNEIAYLGSLNFTHSGTKDNYETRIKVKDHNKVKEISLEIDILFTTSNLFEKDINQWGKQLYKEPIN